VGPPTRGSHTREESGSLADVEGTFELYRALVRGLSA
jgi:hypothetical protein